MAKPKLIFPGTLQEFADQVDCPWLLMFPVDQLTTEQEGNTHYVAEVVDSGYGWVELKTCFDQFYVRMQVKKEGSPAKLHNRVIFDKAGNINNKCLWIKTRRSNKKNGINESLSKETRH